MEVVVDGRDIAVGLPSDLGHRRVRIAPLGEEPLGYRQQTPFGPYLIQRHPSIALYFGTHRLSFLAFASEQIVENGHHDQGQQTGDENATD